MPKYIDAHCHIGNGTADSTVAMFFCNSIDESDWTNILHIANNNSAVLPCLGIHPWCVDRIDKNWDIRMRDALIQNPQCMVGEIGLDKMHPNYETQLYVFRQCIQIANDLGRVVHIHCVHAWDDIMHILSQMRPSLPAIVFHGFNASSEMMNQLQRLGNVYFSFGRAVCNVHRMRLRTTVYNAPLSRILIESDGDMECAGDTIGNIIKCIAEIKNISQDDLSCIIYDNAIRVTENG